MRIPSPILSMLVLLVGCVETDAGPRVGECAVYPDTQYGFGDIGIGSCLAAPADLAFVEREGSPWLAIANADAFRTFSGGSVLMLDWAAIEERLGERDVLVHELPSFTIETESFISSLGWIESNDQLVVTRRLTVEADGSPGRTRVGRDSAYVFDVESGELQSTLQLEDDPGDVAIGPDGRVYVLNYTDHSISVFDSNQGTETLIPIDIAPEASIEGIPLEDTDGSGSVAEMERLLIGDSTLIPDDLWTLSYLPGIFRTWVPGPDAVLSRWTNGGQGWQESGFPDALDAISGSASEPRDFCASFQIVTSTEADQVLELLFSTGATIRAVTNTGVGGIDQWSVASIPLLLGSTDGWDVVVGGPSRAVAVGGDALYYDGRTSEGADASIGVAILDADGTYVPGVAPILTPPQGTSYEQPFVQVDPFTNSARMWLSIWDGTRYVIGHTESADGIGFSAPEVVLELGDDEGIAAPVVRYQDGRYHLFAAVWDGATWTHVTSTSADGYDWGELQELTVSEASVNSRMPPRVAVEGNPSSSWRIEGIDEGVASPRLFPGARFLDIQHGYSIAVSGGQELHRSQVFPLGRASNGVVPTSVVGQGDRDWVYVTITDATGRDRIAIVERDVDGEWDVVNPDVIGRGSGGNVRGVRSPLVFQLDTRFVMFYSARGSDGFTTIRSAVSEDGRTFSPIGGALFEEGFGEWLAIEQEAHSVELLDDGSVRLFLSGNDGSRWRIGAVLAPTLDATAPHQASWSLDPAGFEPEVQLGTGPPGGVDDSGVKDPAIVNSAEGRLLYYSAFDGSAWHLARATWIGDAWVRRTDIVEEVTLPAMSGRSRTFSTGGVSHPVVRALPGGLYDVFYAGTDDSNDEIGIPQLGYAVGRGQNVFPYFRLPTAGDTLGYETRRGDEQISVIELSQNVDTFFTTGTGTTSMVVDEERGFLYVPSKLSDLLYVVDIRDDSREGFADRNYLDLETLASFETITQTAGFRGGVVIPGRDRLVLTSRNPDGLAWLDLTQIEDDDSKEITRLAFVATEALQDSAQDEGAESVASIGGARPALIDDRLIVPQFRDNSVAVFDLTLGTHGEEIGYVPNLGENPHTAAISPDGRYAIVANYAGDLDKDGLASSTLAILDMDPSSPDYLTVVSWIRNRRPE